MAKKNKKTDENKQEVEQEIQEETQKVQDELPHESITKNIVVENDKVYIMGSIKLGLKNYSTISVDFGVTKIVGEDDNINELSDKIFNENVLPKLNDYAKKLANFGMRMANSIEAFTQKSNKKIHHG